MVRSKPRPVLSPASGARLVLQYKFLYGLKGRQRRAKERFEEAERIAKDLLEGGSVDSPSQLTTAVNHPQEARSSITSRTLNTSVEARAPSEAKRTNRRQIANRARPTAKSRTQSNPVALPNTGGRGSISANTNRDTPESSISTNPAARGPLISIQRTVTYPVRGEPIHHPDKRFNTSGPYVSPYPQTGPTGSANGHFSIAAPQPYQAGSLPLGLAQTDTRGSLLALQPAISNPATPVQGGSIFQRASKHPLDLPDPSGSVDGADLPTAKKNKMGGKKPPKTLLQEGLERTNNGFEQSSWPEIPMINQKNYYTDYMKRDDQVITVRLQQELNRDKMIQNAKDKDRALARTGDTEVPNPTNGDGDAEMEGADTSYGLDGSKTIVIHPGSQNLRIGFANDALPKTIPMCVAYKSRSTESQDHEPRPKRQKLNTSPDQQFGEEFSKNFAKMSSDLKVDMRLNKRKMLPNSKELAVNYNKRAEPEKIPEHNDPLRIEWTDVSELESLRGSYVGGVTAQRIPDDSDPIYRLSWPIQSGWYNETGDYPTEESILDDFQAILEIALKDELGLKTRYDLAEHNVVFIIPDLYDKKQLGHLLHLAFNGFGFKQVAIIQESFAASFGGGYTRVCVVDIGAQKTSIACVDEGMIIEESRVNLKYGGRDVTESFIKMMLHNYFPYQDINLMRRYDFLLAEELKIKFCTMNQADVVVQLYNFHLRAPNEATRKYQFKTFDEPLLALMGFFDPALFDNSGKLKGRRQIIKRSYNAYDAHQPDDPISAAQLQILASIKPSLASVNGPAVNGHGIADISTPQKEKPNPFNHVSRLDSQANGDSRATSTAGSPAPERANTPSLGPPVNVGTTGGSPGPSATNQFGNGSHNSGTPVPGGVFVDPLARTAEDLAIERDSVLPVAPLDTAIIASITHASKGDEKKARDLFGGIMVIGGGAKTPGLVTVLEEKLKAKRPDLAEKILVGISPREMDGQVVSWKGGSVYARMSMHDSWVGKLEYERLGVRALYHKVIWPL